MEISRYASKLIALPATAIRSTPSSARSASPTLTAIPKRALSDHVPQSTDVSVSVDTELTPLSSQKQSPAKRFLSPSLSIPRSLPQEPEDARITGGTRSLSRRLLALNIPDTSFTRRAADRAEAPTLRQPLAPKTRKPLALSAQWLGQDA